MTPTPPGQAASAVAPRAHLFGISAALVTPFTADGAVDAPRAAALAMRVIEGGATAGVTLFGTTGEGASLGPTDRAALLEALLAAGIEPGRIATCISATALEQAERQAQEALSRGIRRLLLTPPFYFKDVTDEALFAWFARLLDRVGRDQPEIILYHIPQVTQIPLSEALVRRLKDSFRPVIFGVKDSSGDWATAQSFLRHDDLAILIGDERLLPRAAPLGGAGAISGMANLFPARLTHVIRTGDEDPEMTALVDAIVCAPVTPLVKALVGALHGEPGWELVRPPLSPADPGLVRKLAARMVRMVSGAAD